MSNNMMVQKEQNLKSLLTNKIRSLQSLLGDEDKAARFMAASLQVGLNKDLVQCTEESIVNAVMSVAMLDLNIDKNAGEAFLIKYKDVVQLQISYKGWKKLLYRAGYEIRTFPVFECDNFNCSFDGWDYDFNLSPNFEERELGNFEWEYENLKGVLTVAKDLETGSMIKDFYPKKVIEKSRLVSSTQKPNQYDKPDVAARKKEKLPVGIWQDWYIEQCLKTGVKKIKNQLVLRDDYTPLANGFENKEFDNKDIDYEKTLEAGIVVESEKEEAKEEFNMDQLQKPQKTTQEILLEELVKTIPEDKALEVLNGNQDKHEDWVKDFTLMHNVAMECVI